MEKDRIEIGQRIRKIRLENNLTYEQFGTLLDASAGTVSNWENGRYSPNKKRLETIALLGNTTIAFLLWGDIEIYITKFLLETSQILKTDISSISDQLIKFITENKILYGEKNQLFKALLEVMPDLENNPNFEELLQTFNISLTMIKSPISDANYAYKFMYASLIRELFIQDFDIENWNDKQNHQILLRVLDMLVRSSPEKKQTLNHLIQQISSIACNDLSTDYKKVKDSIIHDLDLLCNEK